MLRKTSPIIRQFEKDVRDARGYHSELWKKGCIEDGYCQYKLMQSNFTIIGLLYIPTQCGVLV